MLDRAHNLPPVTPFVGRDSELDRIGQLVRDPACRLLTLTGPGGIGKTRLAIEAARAQTDAFPDGVFFISLQPLNSSDLIVPAIAEAIRFQFFPGGEPTQQLLDYLAGKSLLLVLDNFEHLLDGAALVSDLLAAAPDVKLLMTSRERLNLLEEWALDVPGLSFPASGADSDGSDYDAVDLFMHHARRVQVGFTLSRSQAPAVARICRLVDGMPLGIELASAWVRTLSCDEIAAEIERGLDLLATQARNVSPRHRNMRVVLDQSWSLMTEAEREVFRKLSVFRGGFRKEAAREVAGASLPMLSALVDKSLLRASAEGRFEVHELLRQYAAEKLSEDAADDAQTRDRHCHYYAGFLHRRDEDLKGARQVEALDEVEADFENVRTAWNRAIENKDFNAIQQSLESLNLFCDMRSRFHEGMELFAQARAGFAGAAGDASSLLAARIFLRWIEMWRFSERFPETYEAIRRQVETGLDIARKHGEMADVAYGLWALGILAFSVEDGAEAISGLGDSLALYESLGDRYYMAKVADFLSASYVFPGHYDPDRCAALNHYSLDLRRAIGDRFGTALSLCNFALEGVMRGDFVMAERYLDETDALYREIGSRFGIVRNGVLRARIAFLAGDFERARMFAQAGAESLPGTSSGGKWPALAILSLLASIEGDYPRARQLCENVPLNDRFRIAEEALAPAASGLEEDEAARRYVLTMLKSHHPNEYFAVTISLPVAAILLARQGEAARAVEVLALAFTRPATEPVWMDKWPLLTGVRDELQTTLGADAYAVAWEHGRASRLEDVVVALIAHFEGVEPAPESDAPAPGKREAVDGLSERELEVLRLVAEGMTNREVADMLVLAVGTVKWYVSEICAKLDAANRGQAVARARELKLLS